MKNKIILNMENNNDKEENNKSEKNENDSDLYANPFSNSIEKDENNIKGNEQKENGINENENKKKKKKIKRKK